MKIILASKSPRRTELVRLLTDEVIIRPTDAEESFDDELDIYENVMNTAYAKAAAAVRFDDDTKNIIIGVDTIVVCGGEVFGKPSDKDDARRMIRALSGISHKVISGVCLIKNGKVVRFYDETIVTFDEMTDEEIEEYISTDEPYDKAGAYAVQGLAGKYISSLNGCYYNVVGFPVNKIYKELKKLNI
ncbi:MAG: septum formation protein Maf [Anaerofustis stercorihominis]|nr:septum formation protein Maf [Anaerofustis stercorihominis]